MGRSTRARFTGMLQLLAAALLFLSCATPADAQGQRWNASQQVSLIFSSSNQEYATTV